MKLLEVRELSAGYSGNVIIEDINLEVNKNEIVVVLGPNGAGKSTVLRSIVGIIEEYDGEVFKGDILYKGQSIKGRRPYELLKEGIVFVPDGGKVFPGMSVKENLEMGGFLLKNKEELHRRIQKAIELFPLLQPLLHRKAYGLSGGERQILALARAMIMKPELYILDEPSVGLSAGYQKMLFERLLELKQGAGVLVVEQNAHLALKYADRGYVIRHGRIATHAPAATLLSREDVFKLL